MIVVDANFLSQDFAYSFWQEIMQTLDSKVLHVFEVIPGYEVSGVNGDIYFIHLSFAWIEENFEEDGKLGIGKVREVISNKVDICCVLSSRSPVGGSSIHAQEYFLGLDSANNFMQSRLSNNRASKIVVAHHFKGSSRFKSYV